MGIVLICISADTSNIEYNHTTLLLLYRNTLYIIFISLFLLFVISLILIIIFSPVHSTRVLFSYSVIGGSLGGSQYFVKTFMEILKLLVIKGDTSILTKFESYIIALMALIVSAGQLFPLNQAMKHFNAIHVLPLYQGSFILTGSISSIIFFKEYQRLTVLISLVNI